MEKVANAGRPVILSEKKGIIGALGEIRTPDPQIRSLMLYPAELRARRAHISQFAAKVTAPAAAIAGETR
jgi:hypothetical protein